MIDNIQDMEWKDKDTLRTMVSKYNSNLNKISTEVNHIAKESADGTVVSENMGYARVCEWKDGNRLEEERYGYFVEQSDDLRVSIANSDSAVLGVTARKPAFASNVTDNMYNRDELTANLCYVVLIGSTTVKQDGSITADTKYCINSNGIATASEGIGYKVTRIIDSENIVIEVSPATELIKQAYTELFNKIENKKAGLIEVDYATWTNLSDEEKVALGDVLIPDHPNTADLTQSILLSSETNEFIYDSDINTISKTTLLHNVFNVDENLVLYKSNDHSKFNLSTITYKSAVEVDLRVEDIHGWRWYCILPIASEKTTFDITTATWKLSGYQPSHKDDEEKPTKPTIEKVDYATFLLENSSDASNEAIFDLYELEGVTKTIIKRELSAEVLAGLVKSVNGATADENGNVTIKSGAGLEIGDIALAPLGIDETDNCRRYLNGQVILQSQFSKFTEKLKHAITLYPNLATTEKNWQSAVTLSPLGQCGKFVIDDEAGTIRLPKVVNVMGALDLSTIGQTVEAGLPNITGSAVGNTESFNISSSGALSSYRDSSHYGFFGKEASSNKNTLAFNASNSNSIYGNSETVQQEAIKYPYFIQVATSNSENVQIDTQVRLNNPFSLFMPYWSPIELNNLSWLRSNKQWNNGSVYTSAYKFLLEKYNAGTEQTETIAGVSVTYKLADNGMKIITDKSKYDALISASGSAWFFVLDTANTQFILPYTNGFAQFGNELGKFTEAGLPNIVGYGLMGVNFSTSRLAGAMYQGLAGPRSTGYQTVSENNNLDAVNFDASRSNSIYGKSNTVQPNSVTGYLYFYIGEVEQDANIIATSGLAESISRKLDIEGASSVGMPSDKIISLTVSDSDSQYTAPADGYFAGYGGGSVGSVLVLETAPSRKMRVMTQQVQTENSIAVFLPIKKGDKVIFNYAKTTYQELYFIYANGAK